MILSQLLAVYPEYLLGDSSAKEVRGITFDSRKVEPGFVFVAIRGNLADGHDFLSLAATNGAIALIVEDVARVPNDFSGSVVEVEDTRLSLNRLASNLYDNPGDELFCVGVTGTNGKTSVTYLIEKILTDFGWKTGVLGTINHHLGEQVWESQLTTPDPVTLQQRLREMKTLGARAVVFEVSSHAIEQKRALGVPFDAVVFTNLSRDHLDFHKDLQEYFSAKEKLFTQHLQASKKQNKLAVLNADDEHAIKIQVAQGCKSVFYGQSDVDFQFSIKSMSFQGSEFEIKTNSSQLVSFIPVPGEFALYNAFAAIAVAVHAGVSLESCLGSIKNFKGVPGRIEKVEIEKGVHVFVDYAHTDDAIKSVLQVLQDIRRFTSDCRQIITVFGCGGDRDKGKRPLMMQAALAGSDIVFVTSDNPRTEDAKSIIDDIISEVDESKINQTVFIEPDRLVAIHSALKMAQSGDVILIAGKGHEDYQIIGDEKKYFSDVASVREFYR